MKNTILVFLLLISGTLRAQYYITTVAGGGTAAPGDGGPATAADIRPRGLCTDPFGNLYINTYQYTGRIRKVDVATGIITTVAGGSTGTADNIPATAAQLGTLLDLCMDNSGNLFCTERNKVHQITPGGIITTIAGGGTGTTTGDGGPATAAGIDAWGLTLDAASNIYLAAAIYYTVRKVNLSTGIINAFAGTGTNANTGDGGPATTASLFTPYYMVADAAGNIYISCTGAIRKVNVAGIITTVTTGSGPIALDNVGNLYYGTNEIWKHNLATGVATRIAGGGTNYTGDCPATDAGFSPNVAGITVNASGTIIYISVNHFVRKIYQATTAVKDIVPLRPKVFPNPTHDHIVIETGILTDHTINLYNISGQAIATYTSSNPTDNVNIPHVAAGTYLLFVQAGSTRWSTPLEID